MSNILKFDNYVYPLLNGCLNITNTDYNVNVPNSFASAVFHQDSKTIGMFKNNNLLTNTVDELIVGSDCSGNLTAHITNCASGNTNLNISNQTLTIYYAGNMYTCVVDTSSNISYRITNTGANYRSDASGHFSATLFDVTHGGQFILCSNTFTYPPSTGTNVVLDGSGGVVTIPLEVTNPDLTRTHAVSITSYVTYVDNFEAEPL